MTHNLRKALGLLRPARRATLLAIPAAAAVAVGVAGCGGNDVPANAVAKVGDSIIKKADFNHWLNAAAKQSQPPPGSGVTKLPTPYPPDYTACVNAQVNAKTKKGDTKTSPADAKKTCQQQYESLKQQVMQFLIQAEWLEQEADKQGVKVTDAAVQKQFQDQKKQSFPKEADYRKFLQGSGMTEQDLLFRVRLNMLTNELRQKIVKGKDTVTDAQISDYYNKNKSRFAQPERRDLLIVLTKTKAKADQAKSELEHGASWKSVAKKYSIDQASKSQGGKLPGVVKGTQEKTFNEAIFSAKKGQLEGPVKTQFGYYVFEVQKITPANQQTLGESKDTIRNLLRSQQEQSALNSFVTDYQRRYTDKTNCAKGFVVQGCKNAPKPKSTGPASGGSPQPMPQSGSSTQK